MRTSRLLWLGATLALVLGWLLLGTNRNNGADPSAGNPTTEQLRAIQVNLDDIKRSLAEVRAENNDLKVRLRDLMQAMEHLGNGGKAVKPERPKVDSLPEPLPELKPLPE